MSIASPSVKKKGVLSQRVCVLNHNDGIAVGKAAAIWWAMTFPQDKSNLWTKRIRLDQVSSCPQVLLSTESDATKLWYVDRARSIINRAISGARVVKISTTGEVTEDDEPTVATSGYVQVVGDDDSDDDEDTGGMDNDEHDGIVDFPAP